MKSEIRKTYLQSAILQVERAGLRARFRWNRCTVQNL